MTDVDCIRTHTSLADDEVKVLALLAKGLPLDAVARRLKHVRAHDPPPGQGDL